MDQSRSPMPPTRPRPRPRARQPPTRAAKAQPTTRPPARALSAYHLHMRETMAELRSAHPGMAPTAIFRSAAAAWTPRPAPVTHRAASERGALRAAYGKSYTYPQWMKKEGMESFNFYALPTQHDARTVRITFAGENEKLFDELKKKINSLHLNSLSKLVLGNEYLNVTRHMYKGRYVFTTGMNEQPFILVTDISLFEKGKKMVFGTASLYHQLVQLFQEQ